MSASIWLHGDDSDALASALQPYLHGQVIEQVKVPAIPVGCPKLVLLATPRLEDTPIAQVSAAQLQQYWQQHGLTTIQAAQAAIAKMLKGHRHGVHRGTIVVLGSDLATQPQAGQLLHASLHAGLRNVAQALAREFAPKGIHVVYVASPADARVDDLVALAWQLHQQPPSVWTQEVQVQARAMG